MVSAKYGPGLTLLAMLLLAGCSRAPSRVNPPSLNPAGAAKDALTAFDANGDGTIEGAELDKAPGLKAGLAKADLNGDKKLSADEIQKRIEGWIASKLGYMSLGCHVTLDGAPLTGATVKMVPEKFLGSEVHEATGTTNESGFATLSVAAGQAPEGVRGVQPGYFRVEISKKDGSGKELIPAKYNTETTLGLEIAQDAEEVQRGGGHFELKSK